MLSVRILPAGTIPFPGNFPPKIPPSPMPARLSASLAYYTIFSLAPIPIIAIAFIGLVFGCENAHDRIIVILGIFCSFRRRKI
jgi:hypothetical protein